MIFLHFHFQLTEFSSLRVSLHDEGRLSSSFFSGHIFIFFEIFSIFLGFARYLIYFLSVFSSSLPAGRAIDISQLSAAAIFHTLAPVATRYASFPP